MNQKPLIDLDYIGLNDDELNVLAQIATEYMRAVTKHPNWPTNPIEQAAIVCEESGELIRAAIQFKYEGGEEYELSKEAIQTGAMVMRLLVNQRA